MARRIERSEAEDLEVAPWDLLADERASDIDSGSDLSFRHVLAPTIRALANDPAHASGRVIDIGCGTGRLLSYLVSPGRSLHAIDPSRRSSDLAVKFAGGQRIDATVKQASVQEYSQVEPEKFDLAIANMVLMDVVDLEGFLAHTKTLLRPSGVLIATMTHPYFWPSYWNYDREPWFEYNREIFIRSEFRTSLTRSSIDTLHVHRPLTQYATALSRSGFAISTIQEPVLPRKIQRETGVSWATPHFIAVTAGAVDQI